MNIKNLKVCIQRFIIFTLWILRNVIQDMLSGIQELIYDVIGTKIADHPDGALLRVSDGLGARMEQR